MNFFSIHIQGIFFRPEGSCLCIALAEVRGRFATETRRPGVGTKEFIQPEGLILSLFKVYFLDPKGRDFV